ncbi:transmembrane protein, putative (macronuclear) [Tetrahymena thermophila SB210]|uniref:Transmembrane protein, putative n=1 Tax=Tetrahymena thermophila (strain SB210) TaxID=312017 RepID=W7X3D7_TETTS|nr:transmembrane protein, putative [Tetrahymena thermophila SB210]EWS73785.1 transmembrane protein, putative [Tetrahymena thermophila SB210]|eukprot:XP_012653665.1 transmembrane protein, putative [Tetrahymena thermophila SB210]
MELLIIQIFVNFNQKFVNEINLQRNKYMNEQLIQEDSRATTQSSLGNSSKIVLKIKLKPQETVQAIPDSEIQRNTQKKLKKNYKNKKILVLLLIISIILSTICQGLFIAINIRLINIYFFIQYSIVSLILCLIVVLLDIYSIFKFKTIITSKRSFKVFYVSNFFRLIQTVLICLILFAINKYSICGYFIWDSNECFIKTNIYKLYDSNFSNGCSLFDSDKFIQAIWLSKNTCFQNSNTSQQEFLYEIELQENKAYYFILIFLIVFNIVIKTIYDIYAIMKSIKINRKLKKYTQQLIHLSSKSANKQVTEQINAA